MKALAAVLDEHFRMLEENYAGALHRQWEDLFGEVAEQTLGWARRPERTAIGSNGRGAPAGRRGRLPGSARLAARLPEERHAEGQEARGEAGDSEDEGDRRHRVVVIVAERRDSRGLVSGLVWFASASVVVGAAAASASSSSGATTMIRGAGVSASGSGSTQPTSSPLEYVWTAGKRISSPRRASSGHPEADAELVEAVGRDGRDRTSR